jgi:hypothetical protein
MLPQTQNPYAQPEFLGVAGRNKKSGCIAASSNTTGRVLKITFQYVSMFVVFSTVLCCSSFLAQYYEKIRLRLLK